jgi:hypothetical protein
MCTFTLESTHFIFNKCPIYTHDGASAKFSINPRETNYSVPDTAVAANVLAAAAVVLAAAAIVLHLMSREHPRSQICFRYQTYIPFLLRILCAS